MKRIYFPILLSLVLLSCNSQPANEEKKQESLLAIPEADLLLKKAKWEAADFEKCVALFKKIKEGGENSLFNYLKNEGRELFDRATDYSQYDSLTANKTDEQQFEMCSRVTDALNQLSKLCYSTEKTNGKLLLGHEIIVSAIANMAINKINVDLVNRRFPDKENLDETRKQGYQKMQIGVFQMISGSLITIGNDYPLYLEKDIVRLASFIKPYITSVKFFLNNDFQNRIDSEIEKIKISTTYPAAKDIFEMN